MATQEDFDRIGNYARMYNPDQNIDRRTRNRTIPLEVLSLGFSRTGTLSLQKAYEILGYPNPYHFSSIYDNVADCEMWVDALEAKFNGKGKPFGKQEFDQLLGHVGAVGDLPCIAFAREFIEFYPEAKIVLVERNVDRWFASFMTLIEAAGNPETMRLGPLDPDWLGAIQKVGGLGVLQRIGGATNPDQVRARAKEEYAKHYAYVRSIAPKERLLEFNLKDGWEPLCKFLGKPVPDIPFPHLNDGESIRLVFEEMNKKAERNIAAKSKATGSSA